MADAHIAFDATLIQDPCLDANQLAQLAAGQLSPSALETVDRHTRACRSCRELARFCGGPTPLQDGDDLDFDSFTIGAAVGDYEVTGWLGDGRLGRVYSAVHPRRKDSVALLVASRRFGDALHQELYWKANNATLVAEHPHLASIYEAGMVGSRCFVAMEMLTGYTMSRVLQSASIAWHEILRIYLKAGYGLSAAHAQGVSHHGFRPGNVLVCHDGRVKVLELCMPAASPEPDANGAPVASHPQYIAPEQHLGDVCGAASDQFSFAAALWEALYGAPAFDGDCAQELREAIVSGPRPQAPISLQIPAEIAPLLRRAMAPLPEERHLGMEPLLQALRGHLPQTALPPATFWNRVRHLGRA